MIIDIIQNIVKECFENQGYSINVKVIPSNRPELCDYQCDNAFQLASNLHKNPFEIASQICNIINNRKDFSKYFKKIEPYKPGFINIIVSDEFINEQLNKQIGSKNYNLNFANPSDLYFLDYGGPNIAKPLHVGHLRSAIVGESIKRIIQFAGGKTISDVHWGDYGLQMGQVIYGMQQENISLKNVTLSDLERIYPQMSALCKEDENIKGICAQITKELQDGNKVYQEYYKKIFELSSADIKRIYKYINVSFDLYKGEFDASQYLPMLFEKYFKEGKIIQSQGAYVIPLSDNMDEEPPVLFRKSNGAYLYASTDIGTIYEREKDYKPTNIIYVADARQELHFKSVFKACKILGLADNVNFEFCGFGTINGADGKPFKTRAGSAPKLDSLFSEVKDVLIQEKESNKEMPQKDLDIMVNAVIKFADLQNHRAKDYIFDIQKFSKFVGKTGPYILYTYLRINKMLNDFNISPKPLLSNTIYNEVDRELRVYLLKLEQYFSRAFEMRLPSYICDYLYNLCNIANNFYENNRLSTEKDEVKKQEFISILSHTKNVIKTLLNLIMIDTPSKM